MEKSGGREKVSGRSGKDKKKNRNKTLLFLGWIGLAFVGGYFYGRETSVKWNSQQTAFLYMCRASQRVTLAGKSMLALQMPDATYTFDGQHVSTEMNWEAISRDRLPILGGEAYQHWLDDMAEAVAAASAKVVAEETLGTRVVETIEGISKREWIIFTAGSAGSFAGGYLLGHRFTEDFDAPDFRSALKDDKAWLQVWHEKQKLLEAKANADQALANIKVLKSVDDQKDSKEMKKALALEQKVNTTYKLIYVFDPSLRNYGKRN